MRLSSLNRVIALCSLFLVICCLEGSAFAANGTWTRQRTGSLAWLHSLFFLDQNRGWAAGSRGALLATQDGGVTWQTRRQPTADTIRDIYFLDEVNGYLVCERNIYDLKSNDDSRAYLMRTTDGGENWERLNLRGTNVETRLTRAIFNQSGQGWAFGEAGTVYTTRDGGESWTRSQTPTRYLLLGGTFLNENSGWLVGAGSTILQTSDGGQTWNHSRVPNTSVRFNSTSFVNARIGWAAGSNGAIYRTVNGGASWQMQNSGITTDLFDVKFLDAREGWAVGAEGTLLHTLDSGIHWIEERNVTPHALERIFFTDRNHGWAVGFGGTIIAYGPATAPRLR